MDFWILELRLSHILNCNRSLKGIWTSRYLQQNTNPRIDGYKIYINGKKND